MVLLALSVKPDLNITAPIVQYFSSNYILLLVNIGRHFLPGLPAPLHPGICCRLDEHEEPKLVQAKTLFLTLYFRVFCAPVLAKISAVMMNKISHQSDSISGWPLFLIGCPRLDTVGNFSALVLSLNFILPFFIFPFSLTFHAKFAWFSFISSDAQEGSHTPR